MKNIALLLLTLTIISCSDKSAKTKVEKKEIKSETLIVSELEKLTGVFKFTEGPAVDTDGNIYFSDLRQNIIFKWSLDNTLDTFRVNSGRSNGLFFDKENNLLICEGTKGLISSINKNGEYSVIASEYNGKRFNQPNDIWPDAKGGAYFTDPKYGGDDKDIPQDGMHVYYIKPDRSSVIRVCDDFEKPNGLLGSFDGKMLYVTDAKAKKTYKYNINDDGTLSNKTLFVEVGCDGMTTDTKGNVYLTTSGKKAIDIFSPSGVLLESIDVPESPTNACFGGKDRNKLFITARTSNYIIELSTKGVN